MSSRLNQEREKELKPIRHDYAYQKLTELGIEDIEESEYAIKFLHKGHFVTFFPYSGWHTGKTIKDGRGLDNLLKQLKHV